MNVCNKQYSNNITINLTFTDIIITPLTCVSLINEIIKILIYEKSQIPCSYNWLKHIVSKKRKVSDEDDTKIPNFTAKRHFNIVSKAYDTIEDIMTNIQVEFQNKSKISEVLIVFGTTPLNPKQTFSIKLPNITHDHVESNHVHSNVKQLQSILKKLLLSEDWLTAVNMPLPLTNMYLMLKKTDTSVTNENFLVNRQFNIPNKNNVQVEIEYTNLSQFVCCKDLLIFEDNNTKDKEMLTDVKKNIIQVSSEYDEEIWYQSKTFLKGYKDCFINKVHASELW